MPGFRVCGAPMFIYIFRVHTFDEKMRFNLWASVGYIYGSWMLPLWCNFYLYIFHFIRRRGVALVLYFSSLGRGGLL